MERLTKRINDVVTYIGTENEYDTGMIAAETASSVAAVREILLRLAAYEDTGLTPEEIKGALPEVVHGQWGKDRWTTWPHRKCSRCEIFIPDTVEVPDQYWQYCPNCGARMDGGTK